MKIISWNLAHRHQPWRCLLNMDIDLALLQDTCGWSPDVFERIQDCPAIEVKPGPWGTFVLAGRTPFRVLEDKLPLGCPLTSSDYEIA